MDITRNLNGARALAVGAGLALMLAVSAAPTPAMAAGRFGTTDVRVRTEIDNISFKAPTVIPFVANADGTLQCPSEDAITIDNLSAYGIHVTNMKSTAQTLGPLPPTPRPDPPRTPSTLRSVRRTASKMPTPQRRERASIFPRTQPSTWAIRALPTGRTRSNSRRVETSPASRATSSTSQALQIKPKPATR